MPKGYYRCLNKYGDACEHALSRRKLQPEEVIEVGGKAKCPGKTESGEQCTNENLHFVPGEGGFSLSPKLMMLVAAAVLIAALAGALFYLFGSDPDPEPILSEPVSEPTDPWQVYKTLEEKSTILRGKPQ